MKPITNLQRTLAEGKFAVTAECGPPKGADPEVIRKKGELLRGCVDAVNVTDNQTAIVRMSSLASCAILKSIGLEPVLQMVTRDRNRIALQSDVLGASALGIHNMLCLSGDHQKFGNMSDGKNVYDLDSIQLVKMVSDMTGKGVFLGETEPMTAPPKMFVGAAENPFADPFEFRAIRLAKKVNAGAKFIQTQCIFNLPKFKKWIKMVKDEGLAEKVYILGGVTPIKSVGMARYMKNNVAGMDVPDELIKRVEGVPKEKQRDEGIKIAAETIAKLKAMDGVSGVHIMAIEWEEAVPRIIEEAGLKKR